VSAIIHLCWIFPCGAFRANSYTSLLLLLYSLDDESAEQPAADDLSSTSPVVEQNQDEEEAQDPPAALSKLPTAESDGIDWKVVAQAEKAVADQAKAELAAAKAEHQLKVDQFKADTAEIQVIMRQA
jgi:hypothetical protein